MNDNFIPTNDKTIRGALKDKIRKELSSDPYYRIIEELGIFQGQARIDLAVVNGSIHGFELKSDCRNR